MAKLSRCTGCGGFRTSSRCPHCKAISPVTFIVAGAIGFTLMACYGGPPPHPSDPTSSPPANGASGDGGPDVPVAK